jgi:hypothetical protein
MDISPKPKLRGYRVGEESSPERTVEPDYSTGGDACKPDVFPNRYYIIIN